MSAHRFHVPGVAPGARVAFPEHVAHHAREVLRLAAGTRVQLFDGAGREFEAVLEVVSRREVAAHVAGAVEPRAESPLHVVLALAALRGDRMELVVQKATELGVAEIHPLVTVRTDAAARPALRGTRQERWDKVASGAAEQCGRAVVPELAPTATLESFLAAPPPGRRLVFLDASAAKLQGAAPPEGVVLLVGPPGGLEEREAAAAVAAGFEPARLGPRVLRSETAAIAALTAVQVLWGDLG